MNTAVHFVTCLALFLCSADCSDARPSGDIYLSLLADDPIPDCFNGGSYNLTEKKCDCAKGFTGNVCQWEFVMSQRCKVSPRGHNIKSDCQKGQWCFADNVNCYFYQCQKALGWCIPEATNTEIPEPSPAEKAAAAVFENFPGTEVN